MRNLIEIDHPLFSAKVLFQGAQIIHFQPKGNQPFLWSTDLSFYEESKPFRGGIPICWPWFGKEKSPSHGFARINQWKLIKHVEADDNVTLQFLLDSNMVDIDYWKTPFRLLLTMKLSKEVHIDLNIESEVDTTAALHTYLYTDNIVKTTLKGLSTSYYDSLSGRENKSLSDMLMIDQEVDRVYSATPTNTVQTPNTTIWMEHQNASDIVVWNPWIDTTQKLTDMYDEEYRHMLCIETARITKPIKNDSIGVTLKLKDIL